MKNIHLVIITIILSSSIENLIMAMEKNKLITITNQAIGRERFCQNGDTITKNCNTTPKKNTQSVRLHYICRYICCSIQK